MWSRIHTTDLQQIHCVWTKPWVKWDGFAAKSANNYSTMHLVEILQMSSTCCRFFFCSMSVPFPDWLWIFFKWRRQNLQRNLHHPFLLITHGLAAKSFFLSLLLLFCKSTEKNPHQIYTRCHMNLPTNFCGFAMENFYSTSVLCTLEMSGFR